MTSHEAAYAYIMSHMSAAVPRPYSQGRVCSRCGAFFGRGEWGECKARRRGEGREALRECAQYMKTIAALAATAKEGGAK